MAKKETKRENIWLNIGFNIVAPSLLLIKGRSIAESAGYVHESLDAYIFVAALAFPIIYGVCDLISRGKWNIFSAIGILSVFLTGGIGLMKLSREWKRDLRSASPWCCRIAYRCYEKAACKSSPYERGGFGCRKNRFRFGCKRDKGGF